MDTLVDDVGSFPLPDYVDRETFCRAYELARKALLEGKDIREDEFLLKNFYQVIVQSFEMKLESGLDVASYPQHYDMHLQFAVAIRKAMSEGTYLVSEKEAIIPEIYAIKQEAKRLSEEKGKKISLRVCVTGPLELYLKEVGTTAYADVLLMFAENAKRFAENSLLNSKHVKTEVVCLDEPSFGFQDVSANRDTVLDVFEKTFNFKGATKQIHLHSASKVADLLDVKNLDVLSFEYAASPRNIEGVSKQMLEKADKYVRVGVSRTDINSIMAELYEKSTQKPNIEQLVESEETIRKRFLKANERYGDRMSFTGPDCGLGGWPLQEAAQLLLRRTVNAVKSAKTIG